MEKTQHTREKIIINKPISCIVNFRDKEKILNKINSLREKLEEGKIYISAPRQMDGKKKFIRDITQNYQDLQYLIKNDKLTINCLYNNNQRNGGIYVQDTKLFDITGNISDEAYAGYNGSLQNQPTRSISDENNDAMYSNLLRGGFMHIDDNAYIPLRDLFIQEIRHSIDNNKALSNQQKYYNKANNNIKENLITAFNENNGLSGAYVGQGGEYYKNTVQQLGPYKQVVEDELYLAQSTSPYTYKTIISLGPGSNDELEEAMIVNQTKLNAQYMMTILSTLLSPILPTILDVIVDGIQIGKEYITDRLSLKNLAIPSLIATCTQIGQNISHDKGILFGTTALSLLVGLFYTGWKNKANTYIGVDKNKTGLESLQQGNKISSKKIETHNSDFFAFLENDENFTNIQGAKTISLLGGTYGNFTGLQSEKLRSLINTRMNIGDRIVLSYFNKPTTSSETKQHEDMYDNKFQRQRTEDFLRNIGFHRGNIQLSYTYNPATEAVENTLTLPHHDESIGGKIYNKKTSHILHSSQRFDTEDILNDFGHDNFKTVHHESKGLNSIIVLEKTK